MINVTDINVSRREFESIAQGSTTMYVGPGDLGWRTKPDQVHFRLPGHGLDPLVKVECLKASESDGITTYHLGHVLSVENWDPLKFENITNNTLLIMVQCVKCGDGVEITRGFNLRGEIIEVTPCKCHAKKMVEKIVEEIIEERKNHISIQLEEVGFYRGLLFTETLVKKKVAMS